VDISPLPHTSHTSSIQETPGKKRKRPTSKACELTATPNRMELEEKAKQKSKGKKTERPSKRKKTLKAKKKLHLNETDDEAASKKKKVDDPTAQHVCEPSDISSVTQGDYVIFVYEGELFPGEVVEKRNDEFIISSLKKSGSNWRWPKQQDIFNYSIEDVKEKIDPPIQLKRGVFRVKELEERWL
jgi:hypothetical protein